MRNLLAAFAVFAPFAILAAIPLALVMFALGNAETVIVAKDIRYQQERDSGGMCVEDYASCRTELHVLKLKRGLVPKLKKGKRK